MQPSRLAKILEVLNLPSRRAAKKMIADGKVPKAHRTLIAMIAAGKIKMDRKKEAAA